MSSGLLSSLSPLRKIGFVKLFFLGPFVVEALGALQMERLFCMAHNQHDANGF